jgi:GDPmannose 4,6-dehydratase
LKVAIISGATGQDGAYLARMLSRLGYKKVVCLFRRTASGNFWRVKELGVIDCENVEFRQVDITDFSSVFRLIQDVQPDEFYNLAAQSFVGTSFDQPASTLAVNGLGVINILEAIRILKPVVRVYQASTSEMFGLVQETPQSETTKFYPRSPYGVSKLFAHWSAINYRESFNLFCVNGILFNHESPLRGEEFVTRKVTLGVADIVSGGTKPLVLGNLDARRDWGFAEEYVEGMWRMLQRDHPSDYVLATGRTSTVREFVVLAFAAAGIEVAFEGVNESEVGINKRNGQVVVRVDPRFYRPAEVDLLVGDPSKAREELGWVATTQVEQLASIMVEADLRRRTRMLIE